ncbi:hypothetical protein ACL02S_20550 [Nocardia sp. 004]|uniref:hypothetical protein n=1 Tax=Nocardia sp. 004 TaxID=3385978 RepID=UPI0039A10A06
MRTRALRAGTGLTSFAAIAATVVLAAPSAQASVSSVSVSGVLHTVGTTYTITAKIGGVSGLLPVAFSDNGNKLETSPVLPNPLTGTAKIEWTPSSAGQHVITATQGFSTKSVAIDVREKSPITGSASGGSSNLGSGSASGSGEFLGGVIAGSS